MIPTKQFWTARPFLIAYVLAVGFTVGLLLNRSPRAEEPSVPALSNRNQVSEHATEREAKEPPIWQQFFRPSQPTVRLMLRLGLPVLTLADGSAYDEENRSLLVYVTGRGVDRPQTFFQTMLPFLRPDSAVADQGPTGVHEIVPVPNQPDPNPPRPQPDPQERPPQSGGKMVVNDGQPLIGIYHTHDWESFISEFPALSVKKPQDLNLIQSESHKVKTVLDLGNLIAVKLKNLGVTTVHAPFRHSADGYDYAYQMSRKTAKQILQEAPSVKVLIDIHRDGAWGLDSTATVKGQNVAKIRCVIGKEQGHWEQNKQFCDSLIAWLEKKYPGITFTTMVKNQTYNQDLLPGSILLEIGNALNQYAEAERSAGYLAEALAEQVRSGSYPH